MRSIGIRGDLDDFIQLRAVGVDAAFAARVKASGIKVDDADDLVELRALGVSKPPRRHRKRQSRPAGSATRIPIPAANLASA